ncbi:MAG: hybrid sensor histidine kinase/response regulator, partial [Spirochaetes bacterium]
HELKSPLAAMINYLNIIISGMLDDKPEKIHEILERCKIRAEALLELIQDLLYINKRDTGRIEKSIRRYDLKESLKEQLDFYSATARTRNIELKLQTDGAEKYPVMADKQDLDRIFMNLISNGIKYNRKGGKLTINIRKEDKYIVVDVSDTGIGMDEKEMQNLFKEFYRIKNKKTAGITGTGLGLATVKRVLGEYNGKITVKSTPDVGSTFTVYFPLNFNQKGKSI